MVAPAKGFGNTLSTAWNAVGRAFRFAVGSSGYDATAAKNKRKAPTGLLRSEDAELNQADRKKLLSAARDLHRNFSIAAWMIRKHLDYVSTFSFQCRSGNAAIDTSIEKLMRWWGRPGNCDVTGRFSLARIIRMSEMRRTVDGDLGVLKLRDGRLQAIEGDRIRTPVGGLPEGWAATDFLHGVYTNKAGRPLKYCVCNRDAASDAKGGGGNFRFERIIDATNLYHFGYFDRFDQVRGISPLACSVNTLRDAYEGFDYALAKMKVSQLFGLTIYREAGEEMAPVTASTGEDGVTPEGTGYEIDFGKGPVFLDLDAGDRAEFLESKSPSTEFQQFSQTMLSVALKALDIPYSFYAENFTNYSGQRQAWIQYELSARIKRAEVQAMLDHLTAWRIGLWIQDGILDASLNDIRWEWIPQGVPWVDPLKEINANLAAIEGGLDTRTRIVKATLGRDFKEVCDERAEEEKYMRDKGLVIGGPQAGGDTAKIQSAVEEAMANAA